MPFVDWNSIEPRDLLPGIRMRAPYGEQMMMTRFDLETGSHIPLHSHPHEQVGVVLAGRISLTLAGETRELGAGEAYIIPGGVEHEVTTLEGPARVVDVFHPIREDYADERNRAGGVKEPPTLWETL